MAFTDTAQSSVREHNLSKISKTQQTFYVVKTFPCPPFINSALYCNTKKLYMKLYFLPIKK